MAPRLVQRAGEPAEIVIHGARLFDPATGIDQVADLHICAGLIVAIGGGIDPGGAEVVDGAGLTVLPSFVDPHVHLRTPGQEYKEDLATGTAAAAAGGYGAILAMPNTDPVLDSVPLLEALFERGVQECLVKTGFVPAITVDLAGRQLTEMYALAERGAAGFTDDGRPVTDAGLLRRAFQYARPLGLPLALHEEDLDLSRGGAMHEGAVSAELGIGGYPAIAESAMVARDLRIARYEDGRVHLQHLSTRSSLEELAWARDAGIRVSAEASPHHLLLTDEAVRSLDANMKMNPPLASEDDRRALVEALRSGLVDCIATDHAPHASDEKEQPFEQAPNGVTGLETAFPAVFTGLVEPGIVPLAVVVRALTTAPAAAFGLDPPRIDIGAAANLALWDLGAEWTVGADDFRSRSANSCFLGHRLRGRCLLTVAAGQVAHRAAPARVTA
jgi:dihydroorotase